MKIGHNKAFWLLFLHSFKICNMSFTLTCFTGKYFTEPSPEVQLKWDYLNLYRVTWGHLNWFKLIWGHLGWFGLPWLLLWLLKILFHLNLFFLIEPHSGEAYAGTGDSLWYIFILQKERDRGLCLLSAATKTFANGKLSQM